MRGRVVHSGWDDPTVLGVQAPGSLTFERPTGVQLRRGVKEWVSASSLELS